ncbi:MAG: ATP-binding cassette domain-containing protein [Acidimicrobiales bacterium]
MTGAAGDAPAGGGRAAVARLVLAGVDLALGGRTVLHGVDLAVDAGVPTAVTGPSGAGKTALCLLLAGAVAPTAGRLSWEPAGSRPTVGFVLQHHGLLSGLTADENVALPLQARGLRAVVVAARATAALAAVGLGEHGGRVVDGLSGGERQRVGIARALAGDPAVLVADEPTAELDPENRQRVLDLLLAPVEPPRVVVVASDDAEVVGACRRVVVLGDGRVVEVDPTPPG